MTGVDSGALKKRDAESYDRLPPQYTDYVHRISHFVIDEICRQAAIRPRDRVLDIGSGTGVATCQVAEELGDGGSIIGIDLSPGLVEMARELTPRGLPIECLPLEYRVMDAENLEFEDDSFDVVINFSAIFHFPDPARAVAEMARVLKPGGRFVLSYTAVRPVAPRARLRHMLHSGARRLLAPVTPFLQAPNSLSKLADRHLPPLAEPAEPAWSRSHPGRSILGFMADVGLTSPRQTWVGRDVYFNVAEEFYEAQMMVSSDLRLRAGAAPAEALAALRAEYIALAEATLRRSGKLIYPFGAVVVSDRKPA